MTAQLRIVSNSELDQAMLIAWDEGLNTNDIARLMKLHEAEVERRLWQMRQERRGRA